MAAQLRRELGLAPLSLYGIGSIVGAGIYSVIGAGAAEAGNALWISLLLASASALLAALSYAELASMFPRAGAEYQYIRAAFPRARFLAFLAGSLIALNAAATCATVALAFGGYLRVFLPLPTGMIAFVLLAACTVVNIAGIRQSTWLSITLIAIEVSGLLLMIGAGFVAGEPLRVLAEPSSHMGVAGVFSGAALLFFMFVGFEDVANLSEEAREPRRNIPRALLISVLSTSAIYLLVCVAVLGVVTPQSLAESDSPLTTAGARIAPWIGNTLTVTALFATASTALITLVSISRLLFGMGRDKALPAAFGRILPARKTPWVAAFGLFAASCALLPLGEIKITASVSALGLLCVFVIIQAAVITLRFAQPGRKRGFRLRGTVAKVPLSAVAGLLIALTFIIQFEPKVYLVFAGALLLGLLLYAARGFGTR